MQAGATLVDSHPEVLGRADLIVKVKEPLPSSKTDVKAWATAHACYTQD